MLKSSSSSSHLLIVCPINSRYRALQAENAMLRAEVAAMLRAQVAALSAIQRYFLNQHAYGPLAPESSHGFNTEAAFESERQTSVLHLFI